MANAFHIGVGLSLASLVLAACNSNSSEGETALWAIDTTAPPAVTADSFVAMVTRLGCSGGQTGEVLEPTLVFNEDEVVVTFSVEPFEGDATCPGNDEVPYVVDLGKHSVTDGWSTALALLAKRSPRRSVPKAQSAGRREQGGPGTDRRLRPLCRCGSAGVGLR